MGEDVHFGKSRGWPLPSTRMVEKEGGLASKVSVQGMTASPSLSKHAGRSERCDTKAPERAGDFMIFDDFELQI